ncbi:MAG: hypothetical protein ACYDHP_13130 [Ferrimicrobium sp.]
MTVTSIFSPILPGATGAQAQLRSVAVFLLALAYPLRTRALKNLRSLKWNNRKIDMLYSRLTRL